MPAFIGIIGGMLFGFAMPLAFTSIAEPIRQQLARLLPFQIPTPTELVRLRYRNVITEEEYYDLMLRHGFNRERAENFLKGEILLISITDLIQARRREIISEREFRDEMYRHHLDDKRIDALWKVTEFYPSPSDLVTWQAREVYEPDAIRKYGLEDELDRILKEPFYKAGLNDEQIANFWKAHWQHPPYTQVIEMLARDILIDPRDRERFRVGTPEWRELREDEHRELFEWYRLVEIPPYWRDKLTLMAYEPYTRVDVRRMMDLFILTDEQVFRNYLDLRYDEEHARNLTLWSKTYVRVPDIFSRYRRGWINQEEVMKELLDLGLTKEQAQFIFETKIKKPLKPERVERERDLTKSEIIKGIKKQVITPEEGKGLLMEMGYEDWEAEFIIAINIAIEGSPESYLEFLDLINKYKRGVGLEVREIPEDLKQAERKFREAWEKEQKAIQERLPDDVIAERTVQRVKAEQIYRELLKKYRLA